MLTIDCFLSLRLNHQSGMPSAMGSLAAAWKSATECWWPAKGA